VENRQAAAEIQLQQEKLNTTKKNGNNLLWGKVGFKTLNGAKAVKEKVEAEKDKLYMLYNGYRSLPKIEDEREGFTGRGCQLFGLKLKSKTRLQCNKKRVVYTHPRAAIQTKSERIKTNLEQISLTHTSTNKHMYAHT